VLTDDSGNNVSVENDSHALKPSRFEFKKKNVNDHRFEGNLELDNFGHLILLSDI
jgi:hypothetical protein